MALKIQKLAEQHASASNPDALDAGVFAGVRIHVNGITDPSWLELKELMLANGGGFSNYYSRETVTHVVCARLTQRKLEQLARADRRQPPIVTPAWVTESLAAGKRLPEQDFALEGTLEPGQRRVRDVFGASNTKATHRGAPGSKENPPETDEDDDRDDTDATDRSDEDPEVAYRSDEDLEDTPRPAPIGVPSARVARVVFSTARAALNPPRRRNPGNAARRRPAPRARRPGRRTAPWSDRSSPRGSRPSARGRRSALEPLKRKPPRARRRRSRRNGLRRVRRRGGEGGGGGGASLRGAFGGGRRRDRDAGTPPPRGLRDPRAATGATGVSRPPDPPAVRERSRGRRIARG